MPDTTIAGERQNFLTPVMIVRETAWRLRSRLEVPPLTGGDPTPHKLGDVITVIDPRTQESVEVTLSHHRDIHFPVTTADISQAISEFGEQFLSPAAVAVAEGIDRDVIAAGTTARPVFATMDIPHGAFAATDILDGLAVRVLYTFDIARRETIVDIDVLYGIHVMP